jgi:ABC-2 type transport system ATP-binding protein
MDSVISVSGLRKSFGAAEAVKDVSFEVHKGEIFGLLGPNGAGKTTTIRIILDLFKPDAGHAHILGGPMTEAKSHGLATCPKSAGCTRSQARTASCIWRAQGVPRDVARKRALAYFERFDLVEHRRKKVNDLSRACSKSATHRHPAAPAGCAHH